MCHTIIQESDLSFGPFLCSDVWEIEKSPLYKSIQQHVKIADFVFIDEHKDPTVFIVEAKKSAPVPGSDTKLKSYIDSIREKLVNTLNLCAAVHTQRAFSADSNAPAILHTLDMRKAKFKFVLVINNFDQAWLPPLQDALNKALRQTVKTWACEPAAVKVVNHIGARKLGLTQ